MMLARLSRTSALAPTESPAFDLLFTNARQFLQPLSIFPEYDVKFHSSAHPFPQSDPNLQSILRSRSTADVWSPTASLSHLAPPSALNRPDVSSHALFHTAATGSTPGAAGIGSWSRAALNVGGILAAGTAALFTSTAALEKDSQAATQVAPAAKVADDYAVPTEVKGSLPKEIVVYQYEVCPFCSKVKVFLEYHKLPYKSVEVNPLTKGELKWSTYKKVPVVVVDGQVVTDSSRIISHLEAEFRAAKPSSQEVKPASSWFSKPKPVTPAPSSGVSADEEREWRKWVDARLVKVMTANIYRNWDETRKSFAYITDHSQWGYVSRELAKTAGAILMWQVGGRMPKKYGIEGDLREALYAELNKFVDAVGERDFLGGKEPNLADLAVFGVLRCISGTPTHKDMLAHSKIKPWYDRMEAVVGESQETRLKEAPAPPQA